MAMTTTARTSANRPVRGAMSLRVIEAQNLRSHTMMSTMDPFVQVSFDSSTSRGLEQARMQRVLNTKVHRKGGTKPAWNAKYGPLPIADVSCARVTLRLLNKDMLGSRLIGDAHFRLMPPGASPASVFDGQVRDIWVRVQPGIADVHV